MPETALEPRNVIPSLSAGPFRATPTGLILIGQPTIEEWEMYGRGLKAVEQSIHWLLGDWMLYGMEHYGEAFAQALEITGFTIGTLRTDKWVAKDVPPSRRREALTFNHHREVAPLTPKEQVEWLDKAEAGDDGLSWSQSRLREEIRKERFRLTTGTEPAYTQFKVIAKIEAIIVAENTQSIENVFKDALFAAQFPFYDNELSITRVDVTKAGPAFIENEA